MLHLGSFNIIETMTVLLLKSTLPCTVCHLPAKSQSWRLPWDQTRFLEEGICQSSWDAFFFRVISLLFLIGCTTSGICSSTSSGVVAGRRPGVIGSRSDEKKGLS